jgi:Nif-specific regulatory protein
MEAVRRLIRQASALDVPLLLTGEPGTGRELTARAIHAGSARARRTFVAVHLGSRSERLLETELFGGSPGGLTGAGVRCRGRLEEARGGSIFLDGITRLPVRVQLKLLRAMVERRVEPVDGGGRPRPMDARIIAADGGDLETAVQKGSFSPELFSTLSSLSIHLPPLRERKTEVTLLADHFLRLYSSRSQKSVLRISAPALDLLTCYRWPGNVRELEDVIARAVLLARDGVLRARDLPATLQTGDSSRTTMPGTLSQLMLAYEREILLEAIQNAAGNKSRAARALGTTPRILAYRLRKHGLHRS